MSYSAEEKIRVLYEDSLADIRDLTTRIEAIGEMIAGASRTVAEAQVVAFDRNEAQLQSYQAALAEQVNRLPEALTKIAAGFAVNLKAMSDSQLENMVKANQAAITEFQRHALSIRNKTARDIADDVLKTLSAESAKLTLITDKFGPALVSYNEQVAGLTRALGGLSEGTAQKVTGAHIGAVKAMESAIDGKLSNVRDYLWSFVAVAAGVGAVVGGLVVVVMK